MYTARFTKTIPNVCCSTVSRPKKWNDLSSPLCSGRLQGFALNFIQWDVVSLEAVIDVAIVDDEES